MQQIVIEGFGGQGSETAGEMMVLTLFRQGQVVQGLPIYSPEQMGGNIIYVVRTDADGDRSVPMRNRNALVLMHADLATAQAASSLSTDGLLLLNTAAPPSSFHHHHHRVATVDGNQLAREATLVRANIPMVSTVMLGALARVTEYMAIETLTDIIKQTVPRKLDENLWVVKAGYDQVVLS